MIYTNLLIYLTAIFLFSLDSVPEQTTVSATKSILILAGTLLLYGVLARRLFKNEKAHTAERYFTTEKKLSILALLLFSVTLYLGDIKYYLSFLSLDQRLPALTNIAGLIFFSIFLCVMWTAARTSYALVFGREYSRWSFILLNVRFNLAIVLPWITLSFFYDVLNLIPIPGLAAFLESTWGDILFLGVFLLIVMLLFPPLVRRLWGCTQLPGGPLKTHLVSFCDRQKFSAELCVWPLFEGRVLTAGVMGILPGLRYIMLTPALMESLNVEELEAVMAHEIGHVKKKHLLLYVFLIGGFSIIAGLLAEPILFFFLSMDWVFSLMAGESIDPETIIALVGGIPLLIGLLIYFRFVFGYFIRNFERQADLYVFKVLGTSRGLISAFHKILLTSGQKADKPNWHHFGIGERMAQLELCEQDHSWIHKQDTKVRLSLIAYLIILITTIGLVKQIPADQLAHDYEGKYIELVLMQNVQGIADKSSWFRLLGDVLFSKKHEQKALIAYNKALALNPEDPELLNNLAWLLLTSSDPLLRDPPQALNLASSAARTNPQAHVLDTLATAYWANGLIDDAVATEQLAIQKDPSQATFYQLQLERFQTRPYTNDSVFIN